MAGMSIIGEKFKKNEVYVPEVLIAARAMNAGTALLNPTGEFWCEGKGKGCYRYVRVISTISARIL
jgi:methanogenic corrinoid protein MtbC1